MRMRLGWFCFCAAFAALNVYAEEASVLPLRLKVLTFNIAGGAGNAHGFRQPMNVAGVAQVIRDSGADVAALQEVDKQVGRRGNPKRDTSGVLAQEAGYPFEFFARAIPLSGGEYGNALLSKTKPVSIRSVTLPGSGEARVFIDARYPMADGKTLAICATHFCHKSSDSRLAQVEAILAHYRENPSGRIIVTGDLNARHDSPELKRLGETFTCLTPSPEKSTYLGGGKAIDHIYAYPKDDWRAVPEGKSGRLSYPDPTTPLSDHWPLLGEIEVIEKTENK